MQLVKPFGSRFRFALLFALAVGILVGISWWAAGARPAPAPGLVDDLLIQAAGRSRVGTDSTIAGLQERLRRLPKDWQSYSRLGLAYLEKARETGDPAYYQKAEGALAQALALEPGDYSAIAASGALALARHRFAEALEWGERARLINPDRSYAYGVIADAQVELGRYAEAQVTLQQMVDLRPDMSSYARISYLRELYGDLDGALELMQWAVEAGPPGLENTAWTRIQLGNLHFNRGDLAQAEMEYLRILDSRPGYGYALAGLARVRAARGDLERAAVLLNRASESVPVPEFVIARAEVYEAAGQAELARQDRELLDAIRRLYEANGVDMDLEIALFNADHGVDLPATLEQARRAYARRPGIYAADVLAWVLYQSGLYEEARDFSDRSLRLGSQDALKLFHAGMISARLGERARAIDFLERALAANPYFSIVHTPEARHTLEALRKELP